MSGSARAAQCEGLVEWHEGRREGPGEWREGRRLCERKEEGILKGLEMKVPVSISLIFDSSCYDEERKIVKEKIVKEKKK